MAKCLFAKWRSDFLLAEQGRLIYGLLYSFTSYGYKVKVLDNVNPDELGRYGRLCRTMENVEYVDSAPTDPENYLYLYDDIDPALRNLAWLKKVRIKTDLFAPYWFRDPIVVPFSVYPKQTPMMGRHQLETYRSQNRRTRIFFAGDTINYHRSRVQYPNPKMARLEIINEILNYGDDQSILVDEYSKLSELWQSDYTNKCVIMDHENARIVEGDWLKTLSMSDFFLSPPGIVMPMCHNIIEAMAVGTIPITNYPEWLIPNLKHTKDCIVFDAKADLRDKIRSVLAMQADEIAKLRASVIEYYEQHLKPCVFPREVEKRDEAETIGIVYTEKNVAGNWKKLNRNSILIASAAEGKGSIFRRLLRSTDVE